MKKLLLLLVFTFFSFLPQLSIAQEDLKTSTLTKQPLASTYYFDKDWKSVPAPVEKGFYRTLIKETPDSFLIQDFYQASGKKQSDPILLKNSADLIEGAPNSIEGQLVLWHENGQKDLDVLYKEGKEQGLLSSWYENGNKQIERNYLNGKEQGLTVLWNEQGQKTIEANFEYGQLDGVTSIWENGIKIAEEHYKQGKHEGVATYWDQQGNKRAIKTFSNNELNGPYITFYNNGNKQTEFEYVNNQPQKITTLWYENGNRAALLTKTDNNQLTCSIWDQNDSIIYEGDSTERCLLTIRNILDDEQNNK